MASISKQPGGRRTVQFAAADGRRRSVRLGKVSQRTAEAVKTRVEILNAAKIAGHAVDGDTAGWVANLDAALADKLASVGLIPRRASAALGDFLDSYLDKKTDVKGGTRVFYGHTRRNLLEFLGPDKPLREITKGDADDFRRYLTEQGLSAATVNRRCSLAKTFFRAAVRHELIPHNPFEDVRGSVRGNRERMRFITREVTQRIIDACPDSQWRLLVALARYGGLRTPSESLSLRWAGVDWEHDRVTVHSPKTEHHPGGGNRVIPLFPELRPYLEEVWEQAEPGSEHVITRYQEAAQRTPAGWINCNLRTQFHRIIRRAGFDPWPKPWQNMRSSRETELAESFPVQVCCQWIGNSRPVALEHYLQVTDEHFRQATQPTGEAVQNAVQSAHAAGRTVPHAEQQECVFAEKREPLRYCTTVDMGGAGLELDSATPCGQRDLGKPPNPRAAKSGAVDARELPLHPDLAVVVDAWPSLPEAARRAVLRIVREARS